MGAAGVAGGLIAIIFIMPILLRVGFWNTTAILSGPTISPQPTKSVNSEPSVTFQPNYFSQAINKIQPSAVAVQSFSGGTLIRYGSGIILTQDGLFATLNSIVPVNAGVIQVTNSGKIYKAKVVFRDYTKNIAIVSMAEENNLQVVRLRLESPVLGQKLLVFAEAVDFSEDKPLINEALVSQVEKNSSQFKLALSYEPSFYGAAITDNEGMVLGLLDFRNQKPAVIMSKTLDNVLNAYLTNNSKL